MSNLPITHYDLALRQVPDMLGYLRRDLASIAEKRLQGPFDGDTEFAHPIDDYMTHMTSTPLKMAQDRAERDFGVSRDDPEWELSSIFARYPGLLQILQAKFSEYMTILNFKLFGKKTFYISDNLLDPLHGIRAHEQIPFPEDGRTLANKQGLDALELPGKIGALQEVCRLTDPLRRFKAGFPAEGLGECRQISVNVP